MLYNLERTLKTWNWAEIFLRAERNEENLEFGVKKKSKLKAKIFLIRSKSSQVKYVSVSDTLAPKF
jgi:hypothetical protein